MKKYKISKHNLKEFFGLFGMSDKERDAKINNMIDNDPILKQLDAQAAALNAKAAERIKKDKELYQIVKNSGILKVIGKR